MIAQETKHSLDIQSVTRNYESELKDSNEKIVMFEKDAKKNEETIKELNNDIALKKLGIKKTYMKEMISKEK